MKEEIGGELDLVDEECKEVVSQMGDALKDLTGIRWGWLIRVKKGLELEVGWVREEDGRCLSLNRWRPSLFAVCHSLSMLL